MRMTSERTNHDAAPAAIARTDADRDRTDKAATRPGEGTGDIVTRLRQTRADMLGTDDEPHYWDCHEAAGEIEKLRSRLRLADAALRSIGSGESDSPQAFKLRETDH